MKQPKIINLTPHVLRILLEDMHMIELESEGEVRCVFRPIRVETFNIGKLEIPIYKIKYSEIFNLELIREDSNDLYVVSRHTAIAIKELFGDNRYRNVVFPNETAKSRKTGKVSFCESLARA